MMRSIKARVAAGVAVALGVGGVVAGVLATQSSAKLPPITIRPLTSESQIRLPVDSYVPSVADQLVVGKTLTKEADACLVAHHVGASPVLLGHVNAPVSALNDSTVLWLSAAIARNYGLNPPTSSTMLSYQNTIWAHGGVLALSNAQSKVLHDIPASVTGGPPTAVTGAIPSGGCFGQAATVVAAHIGAVPMLYVPADAATTVGLSYYEVVWPGLPLQIEMAAAYEADADPRVTEVARRWQACMSKAGYNYQNPQDALSDQRWSAATASAASQRKYRTLEFAVAAADARCQQRVNWGGTKLAVLAGYQNQLIQQHQSQLRTYEQEFHQLMINAQRILDGHQP